MSDSIVYAASALLILLLIFQFVLRTGHSLLLGFDQRREPMRCSN
jgi:hypothetical protein